MTKDEIQRAIYRYSAESHEGLVNIQPSRLNRGEGTEVEYYLLKVDLVASTKQLMIRSPRTYLKFAHVYLSTLDEITRIYGAHEDQTEYAGDSVLAYFPDTQGMATQVLVCAAGCRYAAEQMKLLDQSLSQMQFHTRIIMHFGTLIAANIGPWGARQKKVIGMPIHKMSIIEKTINAMVGYATLEYAEKLDSKIKQNYLRLEMKNDPADSNVALSNLLNVSGGFGFPSGARQVASHYLVKWPLVYKDLGYLL